MGKILRPLAWATKATRAADPPKQENSVGKSTSSWRRRFLAPPSTGALSTATSGASPSPINSQVLLSAELPLSSGASQRSISPDPTATVFRRPSLDAGQFLASPSLASASQTRVDLWASARQTLTDDELKTFDKSFPRKTTPLEYSALLKELGDAINKYQSSQWRYEKEDGAQIVFRNVMDKVLAWADTLKDIGYSLTALDPTKHAAQVWAGLQLVVAAAVRNTATRNLVFDIESIAKLIKRCTMFESLYDLTSSSQLSDVEQELQSAQIRLYAHVLKYLLAAIKYMQQGGWKHGLDALVSRDPVSETMKAIDLAGLEVKKWAKLADKEASKRAVDMIAENQKEIRDKLKKIGDPMLAMVDECKLIRNEIANQRQEKILNWISTILPANRHMTIQRQRRQGTGDWLLENSRYIDWKSSTQSCTLWMYGKAGYGKSILASKVINDIQKRCEAEKTRHFTRRNPNPDRLAYYYCDKANNAKELGDPLNILRCILRQLSTIQEYPLMRLIVEKYESIHEQRHISELECKDLIISLCDIFPQTTLVLDGLDECELEVRRSLLEALQAIMSGTHGILKLFISSRFEGDIDLALVDADHRLGLKAADNQGDIVLFVSEQVKSCIGHGLPRTLTAAQQDRIIEVLTSKADGMFRWVQLSLAALRRHKDPKDVMEHVGRLPPGLNAIYAEILDEINTFGRHTLELVRKTLNMLLYQRVSLFQSDFIRFICPGIADVDIEAKSIDVLDACRHLIELDLVGDSFRLAHASVKEYLVEEYAQNEYHPDEGHAAISKICIRILQNMINSTSGMRGVTYAENFWIYHVDGCNELRTQDMVLSKILEECQVTASTPFWFEEWLRTTRLPVHFSGTSSKDRIYEFKYAASHCSTPTSLLLTSAFDFRELLCEADILPQSLLRLKNLWGDSPLSVSIECGNVNIAKLFIAKVGQPQTPNCEVSQWQKSELIQALCCAAKCGQQEVFDLLIKSGADFDAKNGDGLTPVQLAVSSGRVQILKQLIFEHGANTDVPDAKGNPILLQAIACNDIACVELILEKIKDIEATDKTGGGPLHRAAATGNQLIIEMLIKKGANLGAINRAGESPLHTAAGRYSLNAVRLLIDRGSKTDSRDKEGKTPVHVAAEHGKADILRCLVGIQSNLNLQDERGMTPLHYAVMGSQTVVGILLEAGADPHVITDDGETPYDLAVRMDRQGAIKQFNSMGL
ncbi:hypothetical protein LTR84_002673 [Exophiala bonariae]|uniref:Nephrocystin 3-like N-terminal domain-containing protein n=1 Tax=Exophiala bonariae TaxID=1690606 RepID=A0AAV9NCE6_9EURO|nr:hypothetical protein LTR84_002673 [Exophiala bonariae]